MKMTIMTIIIMIIIIIVITKIMIIIIIKIITIMTKITIIIIIIKDDNVDTNNIKNYFPNQSLKICVWHVRTTHRSRLGQ